MRSSRRRTLAGLLALPFSAVLARFAPAASVRTPRAAEGPFYPTEKMRFADRDNDLVKIRGVVERAGGEVVVLKGRVLDREGQPIPGARVEIWQCDVNGRYLHTGERGRGERDPAFQGFGHVVSEADGAYAFRTIKPVAYPGRAPHIHVKVLYRGQELTTQFYIADHPLNAGDFLFQRMTPTQQRSVSLAFSDEGNGDAPTALLDLIV